MSLQKGRHHCYSYNAPQPLCYIRLYIIIYVYMPVLSVMCWSSQLRSFCGELKAALEFPRSDTTLHTTYPVPVTCLCLYLYLYHTLHRTFFLTQPRSRPQWLPLERAAEMDSVSRVGSRRLTHEITEWLRVTASSGGLIGLNLCLRFAPFPFIFTGNLVENKK